MKQHVVSIIGGASTYTPGIVKSLIKNHDQFPLKKIILMDINEERLNKMGKFMKILLGEHLPQVEVIWTLDRKEALTETDFIFIQIRPGGLKMREKDEKIPLKHGLVGQETCGAGGFAFALRSIPAIIDIVKDAVKYSPDAWILNYSNPESMVSEALLKTIPEAKVLCLCDMPISQEVSLAKLLDIEHKDLTFKYFGLNHFGWFTNIFDKSGNDLLPLLRKRILNNQIDELQHVDVHTDPYWQTVFKEIVKVIKLFPEYISLTYLQYYFFSEEMVEKENPNYTRANYVMDNREKNIFAECEKVIEEGTAVSSPLNSGVHGDYIINVAKAIANDTRERFIVNVANNGIISNFSSEAIVEVPCYIGSFGIEPISVGEISTFYKGLMEVEKAYEKLAVEAILEGSYDKAIQALTLNLTIPSASKAKAVLDDLIIANKDYFPLLKRENYQLTSRIYI
jgi:maltose-6'-phosphate glucosidase